MSTVALALLVFVSAARIDFPNTHYVKAVRAGRAHHAALWSVLQWCGSLVGFIIALKVTLWMLPIEALGLYAGAYLSMRGWYPKVKLPRAVARFVRRGKVDQ